MKMASSALGHQRGHTGVSKWLCLNSVHRGDDDVVKMEGGGCCSCVSTTAGRMDWGKGREGHFQRKVRATYLRCPPCRKMMTSISLSNMAVTAKDFPSLVCRNTHTHMSESLSEELKPEGSLFFGCCCRFPTFTVSCCLGLRLSGIVIVNFSFPLRPKESAFCSGRNWSGMMPMPTSWFLCSFSKLSAMTARTPWWTGSCHGQRRDERRKNASGENITEEKTGTFSLPAGRVPSPPSLWSFRNRSLFPPRWWGEFLLSDSVLLPQKRQPEQRSLIWRCCNWSWNKPT